MSICWTNFNSASLFCPILNLRAFADVSLRVKFKLSDAMTMEMKRMMWDLHWQLQYTYLFTWTRDRDFMFITTTLSPQPHFCWLIPLVHISYLTVADSKIISSAFHLQWDRVLNGVWKSHLSASQQVLVHFSPPYAWSLGCCSSWLFLECPLELLSWYHVQHLQQHWE